MIDQNVNVFVILCKLLLQNEARKLNHQEVVEEDKRLKLPANWEAKKARLEWELAEDEKKKVFWSSVFVASILKILLNKDIF